MPNADKGEDRGGGKSLSKQFIQPSFMYKPLPEVSLLCRHWTGTSSVDEIIESVKHTDKQYTTCSLVYMAN